MPLLQVYVDADTMARLLALAQEAGETVAVLAENAVAEAALHAKPDVRATSSTPGNNSRGSG